MILYPLFCYKEKRQNYGEQNNGVGSVSQDLENSNEHPL
jgi:hypothetical protein